MALSIPAKYDSTTATFTTNATLTSPYRFGKYGTAGLVQCSVAGEAATCIIAAKSLGEAVDGWTERVMILECGGTVSAGDDLTTDTSGRGVTATAGQVVNAKALSDGTVGAFIPVARPIAVGTVGDGGYQAISASGAISPSAGRVDVTVVGTKAYTLADGNVGHEIDIFCPSATSTPLGTITIASYFGGLTNVPIVVHATGQRFKLRMTSTGWVMVAKERRGDLAVVVGTTVLTGFALAARYNLSVTGTVTGAAGSGLGIPNGHINGEVIDVQVTTAASTPDGEIDITAATIDNVAATKLDAIDGTTSHNARGCWDGAAWVITDLTGLTLV